MWDSFARNPEGCELRRMHKMIHVVVASELHFLDTDR